LKKQQYAIVDLLLVVGIASVCFMLTPVAIQPAMGFLWLPIILCASFCVGMLLGGRGTAKKAVLGAAMLMIPLTGIILLLLCGGLWLS
jgi:peptidoglycan/LPS O-acetylase OafA/YrhL